MYKHIDVEAAKKIRKDSYMDDVATGDKSIEGVNRLKKSISEILLKGGFHMKGFVTSGDVVEENLALLGTGDVGRVLGVGWEPGTDTFVIKVCINLSKKVRCSF